MNEKKRQESKLKQILNALRVRGRHGITNSELSDISLRYGGHLGKLYELGYEINKLSLGNGLFRYTLVKEPEVEKKREKAINILISELKKGGESFSAERLEALLDNLGMTVKYKPNTYNS